ncbi:hypothetical protein [Candidatus Amarobacter glycogenicus]|uniref:hypothetical protein n=1 Tax=Candidatus Amarobacter glycogenicus TaxID=3140699 RepID=UPI002A13A97B|nr:hypothetical protein [Dehalococcoidia bacterium]
MVTTTCVTGRPGWQRFHVLMALPRRFSSQVAICLSVASTIKVEFSSLASLVLFLKLKAADFVT